jgi:hypothetical protein
MDALAKTYTAELVQNFKDGKIDAEELRRALEAIPSRIDTEIHLQTIVDTMVRHAARDDETGGGSGGGSGGGGSGGGGGGNNLRASGGPVMGGKSYMVGERGVPELFTPSQSGMVSPPASASQIMTTNMTSNSSVYSPTYNYSPTYGRAPKAPTQDFGAMKAWST